MPSYIIESLCAVTVDITFITFDITYIMQIYKLFLNFNVRWGRGRTFLSGWPVGPTHRWYLLPTFHRVFEMSQLEREGNFPQEW